MCVYVVLQATIGSGSTQQWDTHSQNKTNKQKKMELDLTLTHDSDGMMRFIFFPRLIHPISAAEQQRQHGS